MGIISKDNMIIKYKDERNTSRGLRSVSANYNCPVFREILNGFD